MTTWSWLLASYESWNACTKPLRSLFSSLYPAFSKFNLHMPSRLINCKIKYIQKVILLCKEETIIFKKEADSIKYKLQTYTTQHEIASFESHIRTTAIYFGMMREVVRHVFCSQTSISQSFDNFLVDNCISFWCQM